MHLGHTIEFFRKKHGLKQHELAERIGISQTYLSQLENDRKDPNLSVLKRIATSLDLPLPILFFLALDESDIAENKQEAFKLLSQPIQSMITEFFTHHRS